MKQSSSNRKVNEQAREVIAGILLFEISDPRLELVTITGCEVSYDRSVCNVFYTTEPARYEDVAAAFQKASGRIRSVSYTHLLVSDSLPGDVPDNLPDVELGGNATVAAD